MRKWRPAVGPRRVLPLMSSFVIMQASRPKESQCCWTGSRSANVEWLEAVYTVHVTISPKSAYVDYLSSVCSLDNL